MRIDIVHLTYGDMRKEMLQIIDNSRHDISEKDMLKIDHYLDVFVSGCEKELTDAGCKENDARKQVRSDF